MQTPTHYNIKLKRNFKTIPDAQKHLDNHCYDQRIYEISYHMPQPKYKSWVPNFLIKLITK